MIDNYLVCDHIGEIKGIVYSETRVGGNENVLLMDGLKDGNPYYVLYFKHFDKAELIATLSKIATKVETIA